MRASTAYFVGAGTIVAAIAIGLGGGIVAGNIMNPVSPKQGPDTSKIAQRADAKPATTEAPSERLQYLTGSQAFGAMVAAPAQAEAKAESKPEAKSEAVKPDTQTTQANAEQPAQQPSQAAAVEPPKPPPASPPQVAKPAERQASTEPSSSSDNAYAKARDSDVKRATSERRRTERRERWAERRHYDFRDPRGMRDRTDWDDVARNIREDADAREVPSRPRGGFPQIRLFGDDD
ncbi:type IV secretory pathway VirB10-like protein [Bradyrhizobium sp. GM22.5]